ncbi:MAG TPA: hypothetical protein VLJ37_05015 [bacterium]|nr:hypothetical protein [bacterium]
MWIRRHIEEIRDDPVLRAFGALLAFTHVLTFITWWKGPLDLITVLTSREVICWPFWEDCFRARFLSPDGVYWLLRAYLALSVASMVLFARRRWAALAWWFVLGLTLLKLAIVLQDFQLRLNQHYMAGVASFAFLFVPEKRRFLKVLIAFFYFWAGLLKLDPEWLSGAALYLPLWFFAGKWLPVVCTYVVVLEIVLVWGIFARKGWIFWGTFAQLLLFHVMSWPVVGFFYPTLMFCLLAIYPLDRSFRSAPAFTGGFTKWGYAFLALFSLAQLVPHFMPGDSALTGEGRLFGVHMFDALVQCEAYAVLRRPDGSSARMNLYKPMAARIHCDPIVYWNRARALCRSPEHGTRFTDFDLVLDSRRSTQTAATPVIRLENYCASNPAYRTWRHNEWILF